MSDTVIKAKAAFFDALLDTFKRLSEDKEPQVADHAYRTLKIFDVVTLSVEEELKHER